MKNKFLLYQLPIISICIALIMYLYTFDKEDLNPGHPTPTEFIQKKKDRKIYKEHRKNYFKQMHKASPDTDWGQMNQDYRTSRSVAATQFRSKLNPSFATNYTESFFNRDLEGAWEERGSNNLAGRVHTVDVDFDTGIIYCGSSGGNIWIGSTNGEGWVCANDYMQINNINMLRALPNQSRQNRLLISAGNSFYYSDNEGFTINQSSGLEGVESWGEIYRSTVTYYNNEPVVFVLTKEWDSGDSDSLDCESCLYDYIEYGSGCCDTAWDEYVIDCATLESQYYWDCTDCECPGDNGATNGPVAKIFRSDDFGENFYEIYSTQLVSERAYDIWSDRYDPSDIFFLKNGALYLLSINNNNLSFIGDAGPLNQGENILSGGKDQDNDGEFHFHAKIGSRSYFSGDGGITWDDKGELPSYTFSRNSFSCSYDNMNLVAIGGIDLYKSLNAGNNWEKVNDWWEYYGDPSTYLHADIPAVQFLKNNNGTELIYVSTDGGLYDSSNQLHNVDNLSLNGLGVSQYYSTYTKRTDPYQIFAGSQDQGFQRSTDHANSVYDFEQVVSGDYGHLSSGDDGASIWSVYPGFAMYYPDASSNWSGITWDFEMSGALWLPPLMEDPYDPSSVYLAGGGLSGGHHILKLTRNGNSIQVDEGDYSFNNTITAMAYSPIDPSHRYALTYSGNFYYSSNNGHSWMMSSGFTGPGSHYFYGAKILPSKIELGKVIIAGSGYSNPPVFISYNHGNTFQNMSEGMPSTLIFDLASTESENFIFAATAVGAFAYSFEENQWEDIMGFEGPDQTYWTVEYVPEIYTARFGTYGRGIWDFIVDENIDILLGDLNGDEIINIQDVIILINISLSITNPTDYQITSGDLNGDGVINILDIISCINIILNN